MTPEFFEKQMERLMGMKFPPATLATHWEVVRDLEDNVLVAAVSKARDEGTEFPSPRMLKIHAESVRARIVPIPEEPMGEILPEPVELGKLPTGRPLRAYREWKYYCEDCRDTGTRSLWCLGHDAESLVNGKPRHELSRPKWLASSDCGRHRQHYAHEFVIPCPCASTNPDVLRKAERYRQGGRHGEKE